MPLNLAVLGAGRGADVIDEFSDVRHWAIGGHSLGGAMAAQFASDNPDLVDGLVLWAAYPPGNSDLSGNDVMAISIYGTRDGLTSNEEIVNSRQQMPSATRWVAIDGGNHAQFGWYGDQQGDNPAVISRHVQQQQIVAATVDFLDRLR
jgi:pimeloyl-ACP methyl ester carboxylesterase